MLNSSEGATNIFNGVMILMTESEVEVKYDDGFVEKLMEFYRPYIEMGRFFSLLDKENDMTLEDSVEFYNKLFTYPNTAFDLFVSIKEMGFTIKIENKNNQLYFSCLISKDDDIVCQSDGIDIAFALVPSAKKLYEILSK